MHYDTVHLEKLGIHRVEGEEESETIKKLKDPHERLMNKSK